MAIPTIPGIDVSAQPLDLVQLGSELGTTALGTGVLPDGTVMLHTYDQTGDIADFPPETKAAIVTKVRAHVPPAPVDYGTDAADVSQRAQITTAVQALRGYLALASPTGPQTVGALKLAIRVLLALMRRSLPGGAP